MVEPFSTIESRILKFSTKQDDDKEDEDENISDVIAIILFFINSCQLLLQKEQKYPIINTHNAKKLNVVNNFIQVHTHNKMGFKKNLFFFFLIYHISQL